jgi:hypothetical protein
MTYESDDAEGDAPPQQSVDGAKQIKVRAGFFLAGVAFMSV